MDIPCKGRSIAGYALQSVGTDKRAACMLGKGFHFQCIKDSEEVIASCFASVLGLFGFLAVGSCSGAYEWV